jgi:hypothetical protein
MSGSGFESARACNGGRCDVKLRLLIKKEILHHDH